MKLEKSIQKINPGKVIKNRFPHSLIKIANELFTTLPIAMNNDFRLFLLVTSKWVLLYNIFNAVSKTCKVIINWLRNVSTSLSVF